MELEESKEILKNILENKQIGLLETTDTFYIAIETVLQALNNSIPKKKIEHKIEQLQTYRKYSIKYDNITEANQAFMEINLLQELLEDK